MYGEGRGGEGRVGVKVFFFFCMFLKSVTNRFYSQHYRKGEE